MRFYIITGERSGDLHAANLINAILQKKPHAKFRGIGGEFMIQQGAHLFKHYNQISYMGFWEVIKNLCKIWCVLKECQKDIVAYKPDLVILVDFSGFNLRIARYLKQQNYKVHYYIAPKVWAWNTKRVAKIKKYVDHLYCILPFEIDFFKKHGCNAYYVGNPVVETISAFKPTPHFKKKYNLPEEKKIIAILPGSRIQEVRTMLNTMTNVSASWPEYQFIIAAVSNLPKELYEHSLPENTICLYDSVYDILSVADAAIVTSGTASMETALMNVPHVVCYRTSFVTYFLAKIFVKVPYISLVNLIGEQKIVTELIQHDFSVQKIKEELKKILNDISYRNKMLQGYLQVRKALGDSNCSKRTADLILFNSQNN